MKLKNMKKVLAAVLSTTMVMGMSITTLANGEITSTGPTTGGSITAPIYSYDTTNVVVPTSYGVALNPDGLNVTVSTTPSEATTSTVASKNYGIINKSSKDKLVKVGLSVTSTEATESVTFVDTAAEATGAAKGEYKIYLEVVPADNTGVQIYDTQGTAGAPTTSTQPSALAHVKMTKATSTVPMKLGENEVAFKLGKADYSLKDGASLDLEGTNTNNDVASLYEVTTLDTTAGVTGFTFDGAMNSNADWTKVTGKVEITPTYTIETTDDTVTVLDGTGAMTKVGPQASVSSSGLISITGLTSEANYVSATLTNDNGTFDINAAQVDWNLSQYDENNGGSISGQLGTAWMDSLRGKTGTIVITLSNDTTITTTFSISA